MYTSMKHMHNFSYNCMYASINTQIIVRIISQKSIITYIIACIHRYKYSYNCLNTFIIIVC